jgi:hypothetical protein
MISIRSSLAKTRPGDHLDNILYYCENIRNKDTLTFSQIKITESV